MNHCVNDILACGARPLFFLDYYATPRLNDDDLEQVVDGLADACEVAGCALIGGETAQLPGIYMPDAYDLAGFIVGQVNEDEIVDGGEIHEQNVIVGLPSDGLHTNGFTLARAALSLNGETDDARRRLAMVPSWSDRSLGELLMMPHRSYLDDVGPWLGNEAITGMAHITGGGITGNLSRIIPDGLVAVIDTDSWTIPPLFREIQRQGSIDDEEMYRVFNMGIGFIIVARPDSAKRVVGSIDGAREIGRIERAASANRVTLTGLADEKDAE